MFQSDGPFRDIPCPHRDQCRLLNCIFAHEPSKVDSDHTEHVIEKSTTRDVQPTSDTEGPPLKKQRINREAVSPTHSPMRDATRATSITNPSSTPPPPAVQAARVTASDRPNGSPARRADQLASAKRAISPPPAQKGSNLSTPSPGGKSALDSSPGAAKPARYKRVEPNAELLHPRNLPKPPAQLTVRLKLLKLLHEQIERLNAVIMASKDTYWRDRIGLSKQGVITLALEEEEKIAKASSAVYANVVKLKIVGLKKMQPEEWKAERMKEFTQKEEASKPKLEQLSKPVDLTTGLSAAEEISMLPRFFSDQDGLAKHGYVVAPPSEAEIEQARKGVASAGGWEVCDRCSTRFQVFAGRREEDGALAGGGRCVYHWGRARNPEKLSEHPQIGGRREKQYTCCQSEIGTPGCVSADSHVFKISEAKRLALVMPFAETPRKGPAPIAGNAVCFDCEMGYTTMGMELIRLTATNWPDGSELLDVLVRPLGEILDLNSRFSGVWPKDFTEAVPYAKGSDPRKAGEPLRIVESPIEARELLFGLLTTTTPLIGHAIENDLNAARIIHPTIIDTVLLYPHPAGLPIRYGLKVLAKKHLNQDIQMAGAQGHDSKEDARAAGDLVRYKVMTKWKSMKIDGWTVVAGVFDPPSLHKS